MKFRGKMTDSMAIRQFYNMLSSMAKVSKLCVLRLTGDLMYLIATDSATGDSASVWCQVDRSHFFSEYLLEGVTAANPEIYLELEPGQLVQTLSVLKSAPSTTRSLKVKLTKKREAPCLSFELELTPSMRQCTHDIPVSLIPRKLWQDYQEPTVGEEENNTLSLCLPEIKRLKHLAERYKNLGSHVHVEAGQDGRLKLGLQSDGVTVDTHFQDLEVVHSSEEAVVSVRVELKRLALFLAADHIAPKRVVATLVKNKLLQLNLIHEDICMQYYLPAILE